MWGVGVVYSYTIVPLCGPTCKIVLARIQFRLNSMLIQKAFHHVPDTLQTLYRHTQTFQTPSRNLLLRFHTTKRCFSQISSNPLGGGGWVVVNRYIIMPFHGQTCKILIARIQFRSNFKLDPNVAKTMANSDGTREPSQTC